MNVIQAPNSNGKGGIYLIPGFNPRRVTNLGYMYANHDTRPANRRAKANTKLSNIYSFHFDGS